MMYENFTQYWDANKQDLVKLGLTIESAKLIWGAAIDCLGEQILLKQITK